MWLLIECDELNGVGNNEKQRILIHENSLELQYNRGSVEINCIGNDVHPSTKKIDVNYEVVNKELLDE